MKKFILSLMFLTFTVGLWAQSEELFTHFMFNRLNFNPAYAGSEGNINAVAIYRNQWWSGVEGNPTSLNIALDAPFGQKQQHGVGLGLISDDIGIDNRLHVNLNYAYRMAINAKNTLSIGVTPRFETLRRDWSRAEVRDPSAPGILNDEQSNNAFNVGAGVYWNHPNFYLGVSVPRFLSNTLYDDDELFDSNVNTYYAQAGLILDLNKSGGVKFMPNAQVRLNPNSPFDFDLNANFMFINSIIVGASWRYEDSVDGLLQYVFDNGLRAGLAMDFTTSELNTATTGSWEIMVGYTAPIRRIVDIRYF